MPKTTNPRYLAYLKRDLVDTLNKEEFTELLKQVKYKRLDEARTFCILLWASAGRPNEIVRLVGGDLKKVGNQIWLRLPGSKGSLERTIPLPGNNPHIKEAWQYCSTIFEGVRIFPTLYRPYYRKAIQKTTKDGKDKKIYYGKDGKGYMLFQPRLAFYVKRWFNLPMYFFRHNRLTIAAEKLSKKQLMDLKGAKSESSVWQYIHSTKKEATKVSKELVK